MLNRAEALKRLKEKLSVIAQDQALADFNEIKGDLVEPSSDSSTSERNRLD